MHKVTSNRDFMAVLLVSVSRLKGREQAYCAKHGMWLCISISVSVPSPLYLPLSVFPKPMSLLTRPVSWVTDDRGLIRTRQQASSESFCSPQPAMATRNGTEALRVLSFHAHSCRGTSGQLVHLMHEHEWSVSGFSAGGCSSKALAYGSPERRQEQFIEKDYLPGLEWIGRQVPRCTRKTFLLYDVSIPKSHQIHLVGCGVLIDGSRIAKLPGKRATKSPNGSDSTASHQFSVLGGPLP
ncbi:hypothetical protein LZ32DRAFT_651711 [Colletotrichum eremochloae]|nr:hypothetical protein LZ32DRAFT_651711 [Colletotrichum eremochloae]